MYLMDMPREEAPYVSIPLNTVIKLEPKVYGCDEAAELARGGVPIPTAKKKCGSRSRNPVDDDPLFRDDDPPSH